MAFANVLGKVRRLGPRLVIGILGDRALLRKGFPGLVAKITGCPLPIYRPHPYTLYELNPGWVSPSGKRRHNCLGFRGSEIVQPKPSSRFRVVCMGESSTYGTGIDDDSKTYPARLEAHLKRLSPDTDVEVINGGVGGYTSIENVLRLLFHVIPLSPDLVVYYYTHNDVHPRNVPRLSRDYQEYSRSWFEPPLNGGLRGWFARRSALSTGFIGNIVRGRQDDDGRLILGNRVRDGRGAHNIKNNPPDAFRANLTALALLAGHAGSSVMFVNPNYRRPRPDVDSAKNPASGAVWEHRKIVEDIAASLGAQIVDLVDKIPYPSKEHYIDKVHFTEQGADEAALVVAQAILSKGLFAGSRRERVLY